MSAQLERLVAEATTLAGGKHPCSVLGHLWKCEGGRACPRDPDYGTGMCSQTVYVCTACGLEDYGEPGGPGDVECQEFCMPQHEFRHVEAMEPV